MLTGMLISFVCLLILLHQLKVYEKPFGCYNVTQGSCDRCPFTLFFLLYGARAAAEVVIYEELKYEEEQYEKEEYEEEAKAGSGPDRPAASSCRCSDRDHLLRCRKIYAYLV